VKAVEMLRAARLRRELLARERLPRVELDVWRRARLGDAVRHAAAHSPFWRARLAGLDLAGEIDLASLPVLDRATLMDEWDRIVTDPRLRLREAEAHLEAIAGDGLLLGEYRAMASGGTTGRRGVFVYGRAEWTWHLANFLRVQATMGIGPRFPRRLRIASVGATSPLHMTSRYGMSLEVGLHRVLRLDAREPVGELADALERFRPDALFGYPSALALLADERPRIAPTILGTTSELRTPEMTAAIRAAWGVEPFDVYGITECGIFAADCERHAGLHVYEDLAWLEVEADRIRITPLYTRTQPLIRYELSDLVEVDPEPCPCGRTMMRWKAVEGRADDILRLRGDDGEVTVHPLALRSPMAACQQVKQYRVIHDASGLHVRVVARGDKRRARDEVLAALGAALRARGVEERVEVETVPTLQRDTGHSAKFKLIEVR
jgi:phenylacetate-coenzyme A ligase PaaK-like adenylate-forming protein